MNESKNGLVTISVIGWKKMEIMDWEERYRMIQKFLAEALGDWGKDTGVLAEGSLVNWRLLSRITYLDS